MYPIHVDLSRYMLLSVNISNNVITPRLWKRTCPNRAWMCWPSNSIKVGLSMYA